MAMTFALKDFDGPLDLLLHLISKAQVDIKDIFVSQITDQYIEHVQNGYGRCNRFPCNGGNAAGN